MVLLHRPDQILPLNLPGKLTFVCYTGQLPFSPLMELVYMYRMSLLFLEFSIYWTANLEVSV